MDTETRMIVDDAAAELLADVYSQALARSTAASGAEEDLCIICYTSELSAEPTTQLECGHAFHTDCLKSLLSHRWSTLRISFNYLQCPTCKRDIVARSLSEELAPNRLLKSQVEALAVKMAVSQRLDQDERLQSSAYGGNLTAFAMHQCTFYLCAKCQKPYFGGLQDC